MEIDTDTVILLTSSEDGEALSDDKKKKTAEHSDFHGLECLKDIIEARACMRRKKRKKKNKKNCSKNLEFQARNKVRVDAATEEQQSGQAKAVEIKEVIETESVVVPGNAEEMLADLSEVVKTTIVPEAESDTISRHNSHQKIFKQALHKMTITPTLEDTLSPTRKEETKSPNEIVSSPILEVSPLQEKASSKQIIPSTITTFEPLMEAGGLQTTISGRETSKRSRLIFPQIRMRPMAPTPLNAVPSNTTGSSISAQNSSNVQIVVSRNLLAELSSRVKTLNSQLNNESCTSSLVLGSDPFQQQRKIMAAFLNMSLEDIYHANAFDNVERTALTLIQHTSNPLEKSTLEDLISRLAQFKENVPDAITLAEAATVRRTSVLEKTKILDTILDQNQEQLRSLEAEFSKLEEAAAEVDVQIQLLITKKEELLLQRNSVALKLEKTNQEASRALGEWRSLEEENKEANDNCLRANQMLVQFNGVWKQFGKYFGL
ncbi:uncharacterized protein LOC110666162 [Hevea brasiliensis]|uniref:uncharacterized protein LOC110666162 n=1 Tax=Hevea brasiliensis TaxID=3981 RepID=UPI0025F0B726|nr:uncharacterized protein LOC110666162 [Hevea brasiliensis]